MKVSFLPFTALRKAGLLFCVLFIFVYPLFAKVPRGSQETVPAGHWIYDALVSISIEEGRADLANQAPLTIKEILNILERCSPDTLSPAGKKQYERIHEYIAEENMSFNSGIFSIGIDPEINVEGQYKSNKDLDWVYDRYRRNPFLMAQTKFQIGDYLTMSTDLSFQQNKGTMRLNDNWFNIPYKPDVMDINFPSTGYLSTGYSWNEDDGINFQIGRGEQSVGRSLTGSVIMSEYFTNASFANFEFFSKKLRYNMNVTQFNVDKYLYTHRLDFLLWDKLQLGVEEAMLVNNSLEIRFLNPWTIYHGMSPWRDYMDWKSDSESHTCAYMCFTASYVPFPGLRIYGLFAQDQFQTQYELKNWPDDVTPNAIGFQLGLESYLPFGDGYLHSWLESYYADPYLYIKEDPNWSLVRTYSENMGSKAIFYEWVGSPFGPDTIAGQISVSYEVPSSWKVGLVYLLKAAGEYSGTKVFEGTGWGGQDKTLGDGETSDSSVWVYPLKGADGKEKQAYRAPHGVIEWTNRISLQASWKPIKQVELTLQPSYVIVNNYDNEQGKNKHGIEFALCSKVKVLRFFR